MLELICEGKISSEDEDLIRVDVTCWNSNKSIQIASG